MRKTILSVLLLSVTAIAGAQTITIAKQGHFSVGGQTIQRPGAYDNSKFVGWAEQEETGQSYRVTMPSWIFKYQSIVRNFLSYMCMVTEVLVCAGR